MISKINIFCFELSKEAVNFENSLWLNYNKTVLNASQEDFSCLPKDSSLNLIYWDDHEKASHRYLADIFENSISFFNDFNIAQRLKYNYRFDSIENCDVKYNFLKNNYNLMVNKKCCITLNITLLPGITKNVILCSSQKNPTFCIIEIRNLEKTLANSCKKFMANKKYHELSKGSVFVNTSTNCSIYQNFSSNTTGNSSYNFSSNSTPDQNKYFINNSTFINVQPLGNSSSYSPPSLGLGPQLTMSTNSANTIATTYGNL